MLNGFEHKVRTSAGSFTGGGRKLMFHTTEGVSINGAISALDRNRYWSHFLISFEEKRKIQFLEVNQAAKSLDNNPNDGYQTNRANVIQIEIVGYARETQDWSKEKLDWIANICSEIRAAFDFPLTIIGDERLSDKAFVDYAGVCGHKNCPDNNHWDPGKLDVGYIVSKMGGITPPVNQQTGVFLVKNFEAATVKIPTGNNGAGYKDIQLSKDHLVFVGHGFEGSSSKNLDVVSQRIGGGVYRIGVEGAPGAFTISVNVLFAEK